MKNKICVYAICKNELQFIDNWLESMSEADYIVVMDTGSTDGTYEKLKEDPRVTKVEQKVIDPWRFDVARNESMKLCPQDANILVCTDFDELFNKGWAGNLRKKWTKETTRAFYPYAWSHLDNGDRTDIFMYDKAHNRNYYWKFPVHEVLDLIDPSTMSEIRVEMSEEEMYLDHYQDKSKPRSSYFDLLKLSVEENPNDSHVRMLLAREYLLRTENDKALEEYLAVLQMPDIDSVYKKLVLLESLGRVAQIYLAKGNFDECIWYCNEFLKHDCTYREPYFMLAEAYNNMGLYTMAISAIEAARKYCNRKYTWVERAGTWDGDDCSLVSFSYFKMGDLKKAIDEGTLAVSMNPNNVILLRNLIGYQQRYIEVTENEKRHETN